MTQVKKEGMKRRDFLKLAALPLVAPLIKPAKVQAVYNGSSVFIMGWDGVGLNKLLTMEGQGRLPNLTAFLAEGSCIVPLDIHGYTNTANNWIQSFTGLSQDQTGVFGNTPVVNLGAGKGEIHIWYNQQDQIYGYLGHWITEVPHEWTIFHEAQLRGLKTGFFISKRKPFLPMNPTMLAADTTRIFQAKDDPARYCYELYSTTREFLSTYPDTFTFFHLNPDYFGHNYGEQSDAYENEIIRCDNYFGLIRPFIPLDAKIIIMTDHGFDVGKTTHYNAPDAWMVTNMPIEPDFQLHGDTRERTTTRDVTPTILQWWGIDWEAKSPTIRGNALLV